ncbi:hypothetical protein WJX81_000401 [Elliptochloris bilobata]|uniref:Secreted protein n=1 Tax=Elliptochloris bilobata TaxID=381761 RepID=A0AAW1RE54_9CHLO
MRDRGRLLRARLEASNKWLLTATWSSAAGCLEGRPASQSQPPELCLDDFNKSAAMRARRAEGASVATKDAWLREGF